MSVQDRLKLKRPVLDNWTIREQLCLASSVLKSGDQNWISVSRSLKQFVDKDQLKPVDWYSPKCCAQQYSQLLETTDTPKRRKRESIETSNESIVRRLSQERIAELKQYLTSQREEYLRLKTEMTALRSGAVKDDKLHEMWQQIEQEEREQEQRDELHAAWLVERQQKKDLQPQMASLDVPRKSELVPEVQEPSGTDGEDEDKKNKGGGRSPLLTSLLKSPSPTTQMQVPISSSQVTSPTIASLLGSSPKIPTSQISQTVSPQLHQLVSSGVSSASHERPSVGAPTLSMLLEIPTNIQRTNLAQMQLQNTLPVHSQSFPSHSSTEAPPVSAPMAEIPAATEIPVDPSLESLQIPAMSNIPVNDSMVQIINQIDNIIPKDIIPNVMDKDEMNEFIGDIEELIKEEITASPQALDAATRVIDSLTVPQNQEMILSQPLAKTDPIVDTAIPNIPAIPIEDINSNSNIADIIRTIGTEIEPKTEEEDPVKPELLLEKSQAEVSEPAVVGLQETADLLVSCETKEEIQEEKPAVESKPDECSNDPAEPATVTEHEDKVDDKVDDNVVSEPEMELKLELEEESVEALSENEISEKIETKTDVQVDQPEVVSSSDQVAPESTSKTEEPLAKEENETADQESKSTEIIDEIIPVPEENKKVDLVQEEEKPVVIKVEETEEVEEPEVAKSEVKEEIQESNQVDKDAPVEVTKEEKVSKEPEPAKEEAKTNPEESKPMETEVPKTEPETKISSKEPSTKDTKQDEPKEPKKQEEVVKQEEEDKPEVEEEPEVKPVAEIEKEPSEACEETNEFFDEEPSINKVNVGKAVETYSKKQAVVDTEMENEENEGADYRTWKKAVMLVYNRLATHRFASVFLKPITEEQAPGYHSVIFRPMDLSTIKKNIENGTIRTTDHFKRDVMLMFQNAMMYNKNNTVFYRMAVSMQEECLEQMQILVQVTVEPSFRRETRTAASISNDSSDSGIKRKRSLVTPSPNEHENTRTKKYKKIEND